MDEYIKIIEQYRNILNEIKKLDEMKDNIRQKIAELLHRDKLNEKKIELPDGEHWFCGYQTTTKSSTDLKLLLEYVGPVKYSEIVSEKESTFLTIRKISKSKVKSDLLNQKPVEDNGISVPSGMIMS